jgi:hypothetical protein
LLRGSIFASPRRAAETRATLAEQIIELAGRGERDPIHLREGALRVAPGHCTSEMSFKILMEQFKDRFDQAGVLQTTSELMEFVTSWSGCFAKCARSYTRAKHAVSASAVVESAMASAATMVRIMATSAAPTARHTDMRKGFDGLALLVQETLRRDPHGGAADAVG